MINEELLDILEKLQVGDKALVNAHDEVLDLFLVMLSDAKNELDRQKREFTEQDTYFIGDADSFENGFLSSIDLMKEEINHST